MKRAQTTALVISLAAACLTATTLTGQTLKSEDVGFPTLPGSTTQAGGKITVVGGGADIWGNSDQFHYAFFSVTNDFDYEVQVEDLQGPDPWTKAELMAREAADNGTGLDPEGDDRHINIMTTRTAGQNEVGLQWRSDTRGGASGWPNDIGISSPVYRPTYPNTWLRLMRFGDKFHAMASTNGVNWVSLKGSPYDTAGTNGSETTPRTDGPFAKTLLLGLAVTAHNDGDATGGRAVFSNLRKHVPMPIAVQTNLPATLGVSANSPLTLRIAATGDPLFYQWMKNGSDIPGATSPTYTVPFAQSGDAGTYSVRMFGVGQTEVVSVSTTVTVTTDALAPTLTKLTLDTSFTKLVLDFSEPVDATAESAERYQLDKGVTVTGFSRVSPTSIMLTTSRMMEDTTYTLTVNGVKDAAGNSIAANSTLTAKTFTFSRGFARWERWNDNGDTGSIDAFESNLASPSFRPPNLTGYSTYLGAPRGVADNYGARAYTWFTVPQNGNYVFFMAADDQAYLYLSPNEAPAGKKRIAAQPGSSDQNQWNDPDSTEVRSDQYTGSEWATPNLITLTAGTRVYVEVAFREGGGGDGAEVTYKLESEEDPVNGTQSRLAGAVIGTYADSAGASVTISQQPQSTEILENSSATFSVQATGSSQTLVYQWQRATATGNFQNISGANAAAYTTPLIALSETGARFRVAITVPGLTHTSEVATVTVSTDAVPPVVVSAFRSYQTDTQVTVLFNEVLDPTSANTATNFTINNGITVTGAALGTNSRSVILTTSAIAPGSTNRLTINMVRDKAGTLIVANSQVSINFERGVLYVHSTAGANPSDVLLIARLESQGYYVERVGATTSDTAMGAGKHLIITSSTVASGEVTTKFQSSAAPVINWEQALQDDYAMTTVTGTTDRGTTAGQTALEIVDASHPLAAGLSTGVVQVVTAARDIAWGQPNTNAKAIARVPGTQNYGIYGYDKGALLTDGTAAPERRVQVFLSDNSAVVFTEAGLRLWDAAVNWAQGLAVVTPPPASQFNAITRLANGNLRVSWTGSGTLQESTNLPGQWTDSPNQANPQEVAPTGNSKFFRIKQ